MIGIWKKLLQHVQPEDYRKALINIQKNSNTQLGPLW